METPAPADRTPWLSAGLAAAAAAAGGLALLAAGGAREAAEQARVEAVAASRAAVQAREAAQKAASEAAALHGDLELLASSIDAVQRNVKELADKQTFGADGGNPFAPAPPTDPNGPNAPPAQPVIEYTPELRESLRKAVAAKGVELLEDRVVIPGQIVLRQGSLEYFAVFPGGKAHESVVVLTGKPAEEGARVEGLGAALNSCLMALGLRPGTPLRVLPGGKTLPAKGTPVHIAVEWEEEGKPVRVRAEDMMWDRVRSRSMEEGKFIYVGSYFTSEREYVPDLSCDAVAVYSVSSCVVDLDDPRAADDTIFVACEPRIPPEGTKVRVVFSPKPLEPTRSWDPQDPKKRTDAGAPPAAPPGKEGGGGK